MICPPEIYQITSLGGAPEEPVPVAALKGAATR